MFFILLENCIKLSNAFNVEEYAATAIFIDAMVLLQKYSRPFMGIITYILVFYDLL